jgi:hypothetical protein
MASLGTSIRNPASIARDGAGIFGWLFGGYQDRQLPATTLKKTKGSAAMAEPSILS